MPAPNFVLISELQTLHRRDFPLADATLLPPLNSNALVDGEWLELNASYQLARGGAGEGTQAAVFPVHTERGRYDTQAISKVNVLYLGQYEAETVIADTTGIAVGTALVVNDVNTQGFASRRGLKARAGAQATGVVIVGFVTKTYTLGVGGKVRFVHMANQKGF
jgi:hypothetical protein